MAIAALEARAIAGNSASALELLALTGAQSREEIESLVEGLIDMLDRLDPDSDLEPDDFDCCEGFDDRPEPMALGCSDPHFAFAPGDPDDAEE